MRRAGRGSHSGLLLLAFGIGLLLACFCPPQVLVAFLAAALVVAGITLMRGR